MRRLLNSETTPVTSELAKRFAAMPNVPRGRDVRPERIKYYQKALSEGVFREDLDWCTCFCAETSQEYRVNGQHTSKFLADVDQERLAGFRVTITHYHCDTLRDVSDLYSTFDSRIGVRKNREINQTYAGAIRELDGISKWTIDLIVSGISYAKWLDSYTAHDSVERAKLLSENMDFCIWAPGIIGTRGSNAHVGHIQRTSVVAVMYWTRKKAPSLATEFWNAVRDKTGPTPRVADRVLAEWLTTTGVRSEGRKPKKGADTDINRRKGSAGPREFYVRCIHGWNAWFNRETTELRYYRDAKIPIVVGGVERGCPDIHRETRRAPQIPRECDHAFEPDVEEVERICSLAEGLFPDIDFSDHIRDACRQYEIGLVENAIYRAHRNHGNATLWLHIRSTIRGFLNVENFRRSSREEDSLNFANGEFQG